MFHTPDKSINGYSITALSLRLSHCRRYPPAFRKNAEFFVSDMSESNNISKGGEFKMKKNKLTEGYPG